MAKSLNISQVCKKCILPRVLRQDCLGDISLPESKLYHNMTYFGTMFPSMKLVKEAFIEFKSRFFSSDKCHSWLINKISYYLSSQNIRKISCNKKSIWGIFIQIAYQRDEEITLKKYWLVFERIFEKSKIFLCQIKSILAFIYCNNLKLSGTFGSNWEWDDTTSRTNIYNGLNFWMVQKNSERIFDELFCFKSRYECALIHQTMLSTKEDITITIFFGKVRHKVILSRFLLPKALQGGHNSKSKG